MINTLVFLAQINLEGFKEVANLSPLMGILVTIILVLTGVIIFLFKQYQNKVNQIDNIQIIHAKEVLRVKDEHAKELMVVINNEQDNLKNLNEKWFLSEKEMLMVLNGVNSVLKLGDKSSEKDNKEIIDKLKEIKILLDSIKEKIL